MLQLGFNYPWAFNKYGSYFGPHFLNPTLPLPAPALPQNDDDLKTAALAPAVPGDEMWEEKWIENLPRNLTYLHTKLQISVVRIFLMCNAQNWGNADSNGKFQPPPYLHLRYRYHFRTLLKACKDAGVQLIPSLVDFGVGNPQASDRRLAIVTDDATRTLFFNQVLEPLLDDSVKLPGVIYAWEVMNEPSWLTGHYWPDWKDRFNWTSPATYMPDSFSPFATRDQVTTFLSDGLARIENRQLPSTVGHRYFDDMKTFPTGSKPQFHYYPRKVNADPSTLPDPKTAKDLRAPPFLGEFGSKDDNGGPWNELEGRDAQGTAARVYERFAAADAKGYSLAMVWTDLPGETTPNEQADDALKLSAEGQSGILRYLASR